MIWVLEDKLMRVYIVVEESVWQKEPTEEKKISKIVISEARGQFWVEGIVRLALKLESGELFYPPFNLRMVWGCCLTSLDFMS